MNIFNKTVIQSIFLLLFVAVYSKAQTINGKVFNEKSEALMGASVYIDGTTIGAISDQYGVFSFDIPADINAILVCSFVGYETFYLENPTPAQDYQIQLRPDLSILNEVIVFNNPFSRKEIMKTFKTVFIGERKIQRKCIIQNEDAIRFRYDRKLMTLEAFSQEPLLLKNDHLGYTVSYDLNTFKVVFNSFTLSTDAIYSSVFAGTTRFKSSPIQKAFLEKRNKAYQNSTLEFFRALADNRLNEKGYQIYFDSYPVRASNYLHVLAQDGHSIVTVKKQNRAMKPKNYVGELSILYKKNKQSKISFFTDSFIIDRYGVYSDFYKVLFTGALTEKKVGMMLPADYIPSVN
ncbi:MAG: hypothetical protein ACJAT1_000569 [Marivirga sp.]|jgi:hypothetical protein